LPGLGLDEIVELQQIHLVYLQALERTPDLIERRPRLAFPGLGRQEERLAMALDPGANAQFRVAVAGRGVDVVDAVLEPELDGGIRLRLRDLAERRCPEQRSAADMPRAPKGSLRDHVQIVSEFAGNSALVSPMARGLKLGRAGAEPGGAGSPGVAARSPARSSARLRRGSGEGSFELSK